MSSFLIEEALGHPGKVRVLQVLHKPGAGYMSLNQLSKATELNVMTLSRILKSLQDVGVVNYVKAGTSQLWRLAEGYALKAIGPILDAMENIPSPADQLMELIKRFQLTPEIEKIILYGSVARGEYRAGSDIDLFILCSKHSIYYELLLSDLSEEICKRFWMTPSYLFKTASEFKKLTPQLRKNINSGIVLYEKKQDKGNS